MKNANLNNKNNALNNVLEANRDECKWEKLMNGVDPELKNALIDGYNFADYQTDKNVYQMIVEYQGKFYSEFFQVKREDNLIFADMDDKFRAVKVIKQRIQNEEN